MANSILSKISPGDVILTSGRHFEAGSLPIKVANFFKRGYKLRGWTHAALYIGDNEVVEAFPTGITRRNFEGSYLTGKYNLLVLRRKNASSENLRKVIDFCTSEKGKKYDFRALMYFLLYNFLPMGLHFILEKDIIGSYFNANDSYFCSELVSNGFKKAGIYAFENEPYKIMPIDFYNDLWFDTIERIEEPKKENIIIAKLKALLFRILYFMAAIILPVIFILTAAILILAMFLIVNGLITIFVLIFGAIFAKKGTSAPSATRQRKERK